MKIYIGSDHAGFELKTHLVPFLQKAGHDVLDLGTDSIASVDYPDFAQKVARAVQGDATSFGILICGTGIGVSIAANRFKGIRCAPCQDPAVAQLARQHNNANILALGARLLTSTAQAEAIVNAFLDTAFEGGRHEPRVIKIDMAGGCG